MRRGTIITYLAIALVCGALIGISAQRLYDARSVNAEGSEKATRYRRGYIKEMKTRLHLTPEQEARLHSVLDETRRRVQEVQARSKPEMRAIQEAHTQKVESILTDVQRPEYRKMREEREQRRKRHGSRVHDPQQSPGGC
jgi:Spy/CpxP family protein refolding chaperone